MSVFDHIYESLQPVDGLYETDVCGRSGLHRLAAFLAPQVLGVVLWPVIKPLAWVFKKLPNG